MINVALVHEGKAYLPEIAAYEKYLNKHPQFKAEVVSEVKPGMDYDIVWKVMGFDPVKTKGAVLIHEYNTLTVGKNRAIKDVVKKLFNTKPNGRVYQSEFMKDFYNFKDKAPFIFREQGIDQSYFNVVSEKIYDFVYIGSMDESRQLDAMFEFFSKTPKWTLLLIGTPNEKLKAQYSSCENIIYTGRLEQSEIPAYASKARYGLNYVPDIYPFNEQISTKLLEYCALNLKIVTLPGRWVNNFESSSQAKFFKVKKNLSNLTAENLNQFDFITPDVRNLEWNKLLENSGLIPFLLDLSNNKAEQ
ncbi:glycosyltransferase family 4 protein [Macrococcus equipercicus]|uniref:Glycosyltransferase family 4 protein n=1 Tax=Macrococcus equipercicus TaxID=69967 RepID=A0ABQ6R867_9STAP|nr:glycosyltransferase family 4 protein [Macrococcus equipercicus]KAA1039309.1 glycosyltransferase family 4 protein [Macrococcus equipercicus]